MMDWLEERNVKCNFILHKGKLDYPSSIIQTIRILKKLTPEVVHCHMLDANLIGLVAAKTVGVPKRIYTRHHSTFHHESHSSAVKYDKFSNWLATDIVAISQNVSKILIEKEGCNKDKIHLIHHGFDLSSFSKENVSEDLGLKYDISKNDGPVIGVVSRYMEWKGVVYIIQAFQEFLKKYPRAKLVLANAHGPYKKQIAAELKKIPKQNYVEIGFEQNLFALYQLFDIYVHTPINSEIEAFGQTYVEALAAGIPSIFTLSGIANEFIIDQENALVVPYKNSGAIEKKMKLLVEDQKLNSQLRENGRKSVQEFNLEKFIFNLEKLYSVG